MIVSILLHKILPAAVHKGLVPTRSSKIYESVLSWGGGEGGEGGGGVWKSPVLKETP